MIRLLAIDTAAETVGVAVAVGGEVRAEIVEASATEHSRRLFRLVDAVLGGADLRKTDLTHVGVTVGPGSFTGLRVGLATAKGIAYALNIPLAGVSSLCAMAGGSAPFPGTVVPILDARKRQVYGGAWDGMTREVRIPEGVWDPAVFVRELSRIPGLALVLGSGLGTYRAVFQEALGDRLVEAAQSRWHIPPRQVALLAYGEAEAGRAVAPALLAPVYHRLSEAEERKRRV